MNVCLRRNSKEIKVMLRTKLKVDFQPINISMSKRKDYRYCRSGEGVYFFVNIITNLVLTKKSCLPYDSIST